jgi:hypothetical protein
LSAALICIATCVLGAAADNLAFQDRGNRLEGYQRREIAAPAFEVLGFVRGSRLSSLRSPAAIQLGFFLPKAARVTIRASELAPIKLYEMQAKQVEWPSGWNTFGPWATSEVISPLGVPLENIAVLAQGAVEQGTEAELVPVSFVQAQAAIADYEFQFRIKYDVETARYRVERVDSSKVVRSGLLHEIPGETAASVRFDLTNEAEGRYRLVLDCLYKGRAGGPQRMFTFYHVKAAPNTGAR